MQTGAARGVGRAALAVAALVAILPLLVAEPVAAADPSPELWSPPAGATPSTGSWMYVEAEPGVVLPDAYTGLITDVDADADYGPAYQPRGGTWAYRDETFWNARFMLDPSEGRLSTGLHVIDGDPDEWMIMEARDRWCQDQWGWIQIDDLAWDGDSVTSITGRFEARCDEGNGPALRGAWHWAAGPRPPSPTPVADPGDLWRPDPDLVPAGPHLYLEGVEVGEAPVVLTGSQLSVEPDVPATRGTSGPGIRFTAGVPGGDRTYGGNLSVGNRSTRIEPGYYGDLRSTAGGNEVRGGIDVRAAQWVSCWSDAGWFVVDHVVYAGDELRELSVRFWRACGDTEVRGELVWAASPRVTAIEPTAGQRRGGDEVYVTGADLREVQKVEIGGVEAERIIEPGDSPWVLRVRTPELPLGEHPVVVTTAAGTSPVEGAPTWNALPNKPLAPESVVIEPGQASMVVSWVPSADRGDLPVTATRVRIAPHWLPDSTLTAVDVDPSESVAFLGGLEPNGLYRVDVTDLTADGPGQSTQQNLIRIPEADVVPFDGVSALVTQQFVDFAGRSPSTAERDLVTKAIRTGGTTTDAFVAGMRSRAEWGGVRSPVIRLYSAFYGRLPDASGLSYWARKLRTGTSVGRVAAQFAGSTEFRRRYGSLSDSGFVDLVYRNVLGRGADASGRAYWVRKLRGGTSRGTVMANFSESREHVRRMQPTVDAVLLYTGLLRRTPTAAELGSPAGPTRAATATVDPVALTRDLRHSDAYAQRFG